MPQIAELKEIDGQLWARIPGLLFGQEESVTLWTESEKEEVLAAERRRCMYVIQRLGELDAEAD